MTSSIGSAPPTVAGISIYPSSLSFASSESALAERPLTTCADSADDFHLSPELSGGLVGFNSQGMLQNWTNQNQIMSMNQAGSPQGGSGQMPQLSVSSSSPPPSHSPSAAVKVKSEPISPPRDLSHHHSLALNRASSNTPSHLSPGHPPLTPSTSSSPDPSGAADFDDVPVHKRMRVGSESTWPA